MRNRMAKHGRRYGMFRGSFLRARLVAVLRGERAWSIGGK